MTKEQRSQISSRGWTFLAFLTENPSRILQFMRTDMFTFFCSLLYFVYQPFFCVSCPQLACTASLHISTALQPIFWGFFFAIFPSRPSNWPKISKMLLKWYQRKKRRERKRCFTFNHPLKWLCLPFPGSKYQSVLPKRLISQQGYLRCPQLVQSAAARLITATKRWEHTASVHGFLLVLEHILKFYYPLQPCKWQSPKIYFRFTDLLCAPMSTEMLMEPCWIPPGHTLWKKGDRAAGASSLPNSLPSELRHS